MTRLIHEIHRRSLWQVLGIYLVVSWVVLQVVDVLAQNMSLPEWVFPFAIVLLVLGLPVVLATAFVQEGVSGGQTQSGSGDSPNGAQAAKSSGLFTWRNAIGGGVAAFALWGVVATGWMLMGPGVRGADGDAAAEVSTVDRRSIAVLPFATRATQADEEAVIFSEGMHNDVLTQLAKVDSLTVISRTSVMKYRDTEMSIPDIAAELGVASVLEGGVDRAGGRVRVNVQLIDAETDEHLWAETYDEVLSAANIFAIRADLARKITSALRATLSPEVEQRIEAQPTESLEAYDLYTRGRYIFESPRGTDKDGLEEAEGLFRKAIETDSSYAPAWSSLAQVYLSLENWDYMPSEEARASASHAVDRALALEPDLADGYSAQARLLASAGRLEDAERAILKAIELNPGSARVHGRYGALLEEMRRYDESVAEGRRAVELDPISVNTRMLLADRLFFAADFAGSIDESLKVLEMEPDAWYPYYNLGWAYSVTDEHPKAIEVLEKALKLNPDAGGTIRLGLAYAHARAGNRDEALALVQAEESEDSYDIPLVYYELGEVDLAFEFLERVLRLDRSQLTRLQRDPSGAAIRDDPRFGEVLRKLELESRPSS